MYIISGMFNSIYTKMIIEELAGGKNNRLLVILLAVCGCVYMYDEYTV